jgi:hypothetical protein
MAQGEKSARILDFGCGPASFLALLRDEFGFENIEGLELNENSAGIAARSYGITLIPRMEAPAAMVEIDAGEAHTPILQGAQRDQDQPWHRGPYQNGWLNTDYEPLNRDIVFVDVTERFPFPEQSVAAVERYPLRKRIIVRNQHAAFAGGDRYGQPRLRSFYQSAPTRHPRRA